MAVPVYADDGEQIILPIETWTAYQLWQSAGWYYSNDSVTESTELSGEFSGSISGSITSMHVGSQTGNINFSSTDVQQFVGYLGAIDTSAYLEMGDTSTAGLDDIELTIDFTEGNGSQERIICNAANYHAFNPGGAQEDYEYDKWACTWSPALKASVEVSEDSPTYVRLGHLRNDMMTFGYATDNPDSMLFLDGATTGSASGQSSISISESGSISGSFYGTMELEGTTTYDQTIELPWLQCPANYSLSNMNHGLLIGGDYDVFVYMYKGREGLPSINFRNYRNNADYTTQYTRKQTIYGDNTVVWYTFPNAHEWFRIYFTSTFPSASRKVCPLYAGKISELPDSIASMMGLPSGTNRRLDTIIEYMDQGNSSTNTTNNNQATQNMNTATNTYHSQEQSYQNAVTDALEDIPTSDSAFNNGTFLNSMNWIKYQIDNWILDDNPFVALSVTILLVGVIAVFIGRL